MGQGSAELSPRTKAVVDELAGIFLNEAAAIDAGELPVTWHLDVLARCGLYGAFAPVEVGGMGLGPGQLCAVVEELASCCLASTFVWAQHFRLLAAVVNQEMPAPLSQALLGPVVSGQVKGGVALTGLMPGPVKLHAHEADGGWRLTGGAPWVSGWGMVGTLLVAARTGDDQVLTLLMEATAQPGVSAVPLRLSAADATRTVRLHFEDFFVPAASVVGLEPFVQARAKGERLRLNGSFALGVARRCALLLGPSPLDQQLAGCRAALDEADNDRMPAARAAACRLAVRAAHALSVQRGSSSALAGDIAERLTREAALLLVFASRPAIKDAMLAMFVAL